LKIISKRGREGKRTTLSPDQLQEMLKCSSDPLYFIRKYIQLPSAANAGTHRVMLQTHHCDYVTTAKAAKSMIAMMPRGSGMTTMSLAFILWEVLFRLNHKALIFGISNEITRDMYNIVTHMLFHIPAFLRPQIKGNRKSYIEFSTGSSLLFESMTSLNVMRGRTLSRIYLDSFAYAPDGIQRAIYNDICPTLIIGGSVLIASTPNGKHNTFADAWIDSFKPTTSFVPFKRTIDDMTFSPTWKQRTKAQVGNDLWLQNYMCEFI
jgi:hypothetical protein